MFDMCTLPYLIQSAQVLAGRI